MRTDLNIMRYTLIVGCAIVGAWLCANTLGSQVVKLYVYPLSGTSFLGFPYIVGFLAGYSVFLGFLMLVIGGYRKLIALTVCILPLVALELFISAYYELGLFLLFAMTSALIGWLLRKIIYLTIGKYPPFAPWQRFF